MPEPLGASTLPPAVCPFGDDCDLTVAYMTGRAYAAPPGSVVLTADEAKQVREGLTRLLAWVERGMDREGPAKRQAYAAVALLTAKGA